MKPFNVLHMVSAKQVISKGTAFVLKGRVKGKTGLLVTDKLRFRAHDHGKPLGERGGTSWQ